MSATHTIAWLMRATGCDGSADWVEIGSEEPDPMDGFEAVPLGDVREMQAEVDRITEAGRVHIRRAAAFEAQRDGLAEALVELRDRIKGHPAYAWLTEDEEMCVGGDAAELSYLARVADAALSAMGGGER